MLDGCIYVVTVLSQHIRDDLQKGQGRVRPKSSKGRGREQVLLSKPRLDTMAGAPGQAKQGMHAGV